MINWSDFYHLYDIKLIVIDLFGLEVTRSVFNSGSFFILGV